MNKEEAIAKINEREDGNFVVFEENEHTTFLENYAKSKVEDAQSEITRTIHSQYDEDLKGLFGESKGTNEKTYNFLKRKFEDLSDKSKQSEPLRAKIKELEDALKNNAGDDKLRDELETVRKKFQSEKDAWESEKTEILTNTQKYKLSNELDKAMVGLSFKKDIPDAVRDTFVDKVKAELIKAAEMVDGKLVFKDDEGKTVLNDRYEPMTAQDLLKKEMESIIVVGKKKDGMPEVNEEEDDDGKKVVRISNPNAKTRAEVTEYLIKAGLRNGTKEYNESYKEFTKHLDPMK